MAHAAFKALQNVAERCYKHVVYNSPVMEPQWQQEYDSELQAATQTALDVGVSAEKVFDVLFTASARSLDQLPDKYMAMCVEGGLSLDTDIDGETLLHRLLNAPLPVTLGPLSSSSNISSNGTAAAPPAAEAGLLHGADAPWNLLLQQMSAGSNPASGQVTLEQLLKRKHTADLQDAAGNTALHMVVACLVSKVHFPDPKLTAAEPEADAMNCLPNDLQQSFAQQELQKTATTAALLDPDKPETLQDHDAARAAYAAVGFRMLMDAGWHPGVRNANGYTVIDLIEAGLNKYQAELYDLVDPDGVAQTTVVLLKEKAPDKHLQDFLDTKIAGVKAVVRCLQEMHISAASIEQPRQARSALSLIILWLLLLVACVYWIYGGRLKQQQ